MSCLIKKKPISQAQKFWPPSYTLTAQGILFLLAFGMIPTTFAIETIYENCHWRSKSWTEKLVSTINDKNRSATAAEAVCQNCSETSPHSQGLTALQDIANGLNATKEIPEECFLASSIRKYKEKGSRKRFYYCPSPGSSKTKDSMPVTNDAGQTRYFYPRSPCLNKDYTNMIKDSFHYMADCFDFEKEDLSYLFALFNPRILLCSQQKKPHWCTLYRTAC